MIGFTGVTCRSWVIIYLQEYKWLAVKTPFLQWVTLHRSCIVGAQAWTCRHRQLWRVSLPYNCYWLYSLGKRPCKSCMFHELLKPGELIVLEHCELCLPSESQGPSLQDGKFQYRSYCCTTAGHLNWVNIHSCSSMHIINIL